MKEKLIRKSIFIVNILLAIISFFVAVSFFTSNEKLGFILAVVLIMITGGQYYIQKIETLKYKIIATISSLAILLIVGEIASGLHI